MKTEKATHEPYNIELFAPIIKESNSKYIAVLSDTSIDRDEERVGKSALIKIANGGGYIAGLIDHDNKVLNQVAQWTNIQIKDIDGHTALVAEPKFFESNPNAKIIKGMLDEGAQIGISIGAIVKDYEEQKVNEKMYKTFTDLELVEASFVAIPSNRHGRIMAVAKSFKKKVEVKMEFTQKDIDSAVEVKSVELNKIISEKDNEILNLNKTVKSLEEEKESIVEEKTKIEESNKKLQEELEASKKVALEKQKFTEEGETPKEDLNKSFDEGKIPILRI